MSLSDLGEPFPGCLCLPCMRVAAGRKQEMIVSRVLLNSTEEMLSGKQEQRITDPTTGGQKGTKLERYDLIPVGPLAEVARIYGKGAQKYADRNWEKSYKYSLSYAALQRHVNAFWAGEDKDAETGCSHLAAAVFHCFALMQFQETNPEQDDRPKKGNKP